MGLLLPYANSDTMKIHLEHIEALIPEGKHAIVVLDQAGWHTTQKLGVFQRLSLLSLPPYSPELNPVEHIWKYIRTNKGFNNNVYPSIEKVEAKLCEALKEIYYDKTTMKSLCNYNWINYTYS